MTGAIILFLIVYLVGGVLINLYYKVQERKLQRRQAMDDGGIPEEEWNQGTPDDPLPEDAKPFEAQPHG